MPQSLRCTSETLRLPCTCGCCCAIPPVYTTGSEEHEWHRRCSCCQCQGDGHLCAASLHRACSQTAQPQSVLLCAGTCTSAWAALSTSCCTTCTTASSPWARCAPPCVVEHWKQGQMLWAASSAAAAALTLPRLPPSAFCSLHMLCTKGTLTCPLGSCQSCNTMHAPAHGHEGSVQLLPHTLSIWSCCRCCVPSGLPTALPAPCGRAASTPAG